MASEQDPGPRNVDANHLDAEIATSGKRPLNDRGDYVFEVPKPPSNGRPWSLGADKKAGFSFDREKSVQRYLTEGGHQLRTKT